MGSIADTANTKIVDGMSKADLRAVFHETDARVENHETRIDAAETALGSINARFRPGDNPSGFSHSLAGGDRTTVPSLPSSIITVDSDGSVARIVGANVVAPRSMVAIEPEKKWLVAWAFRRRVNTDDPANDSVTAAIAWYGQGKGQLTSIPTTVIDNLVTLTTGSGRQVVTAVISRSAGGDVDIVAPETARYFLPYVETIGTLTQNDVEVIAWHDVTHADLLTADVSAFEARLAALESLDAGNRLDAVEGLLTGSEIKWYKTRSAAIADTPPVDVDAIYVLGDTAAGDGGGGLFVYTASEPSVPAADKFLNAKGDWYERRSQLTSVADIEAIADAIAEAKLTYTVEGATHPVPQILRTVFLTPRDFGWTASGSITSQTAALKAWAASPRPGRLEANTDYFFSYSTGGLLVVAGKIIEGNDAYLVNENVHGKILTLVPGDVDPGTGMHEGGWRIHGLRMRGAFNGTDFSPSGYGIYVAGTDNHGSGVAPTYVDEFELDNVTIENVANTAFFEQFTHNRQLISLKAYNIARSGGVSLSCRGGRSWGRVIENVGVASAGANTYGIIYTRDPADGRTLVTAPRSSDCIEDTWRVVNNTIWEAADAHAGEYIKFLNGYAENVRRGINIGYDQDSADAHGSIGCEVRGNTIIGRALADPTNSMQGMTVAGYPSASDGLTLNTIVEGNRFIHCGRASDPDRAGVWLTGTRGTRLHGNTYRECASSAIHVQTNNAGLLIGDESITDTFSDGLAAGVWVSGINNDVTFNANTFAKSASLSWSPSSHQPYCYSIANQATITVNFVGGDLRTGAGVMTLRSVGAHAVVNAATWTQINP